MNKCVKITIKNIINNDIDRKQLNKILWDISYKTAKACNKVLSNLYSFTQDNMEHKELYGESINEKALYGKTYGAVLQNKMTKIMDNCNTGNVAQTYSFINKRFKDDVKKGLFKGDVSLSNLKKNTPIMIKNSNYHIFKGDNGFEIELSLFNMAYQKENDIKKIELNIDKLDNSKGTILNRIISGQYKQGAAQIIEDRKKKGKWYFIISYEFENNEIEEINKNKILGIDLGITNIATMQIYDSERQKYDWLNWKECMISGKELIHFRQKIEARKRDLSITSKCVGDGRIGHGYKTRMKPVLDIGDKIARFRDTYNHKVSKYIVDFAVKHNCGYIQMEDLSGFSEQQSESFLKNWSYYDLKLKIEYKMIEKGLYHMEGSKQVANVTYVSPSYTSKRCSKCGSIHEDNRDCKNNQAKFKCVICGHEENADINAAKNIAIPYIDTIIKETLKDMNKNAK